jgi:hypothetical protein
MKKAIKYKIINHGYEHIQYFQGQGVAFTEYDMAFTGTADNAKEAYNDALEQIYETDIDPASLDKIMPTRPHGIRAADKVPARYLKDEYNEYYWHVSILIKLKK